MVDRIAADFPRTAPVHPRHDLPRAVRAAALGGAAGQGAGHEQPVDHGQLRRAGLDLPGRQPVGAARLPAARLRRDDPAGDPVLRPVRPVDGLRGLPAVADEGGLGPDRRQPRGGRPRAWSGAAGSSPRRRSSWSSWPARSPSPTSCSSRRSGLGMAIAVALDATIVRALLVPGHDAPARATGTGGCRPARALAGRPAAGPEAEVEAAAPMSACCRARRSGRRALAASARCASPSAPCCGVRGPDPGQPRRVVRPAARPPDAVGPAARSRSRSSLPRDDGPHDRLTEWWYYTGHLRDARAGAATASSTSSSGPSGATSRSPGRRTWRSPTRPAARFLYAQRAEIGPQVDRSAARPARLRPGSRWPAPTPRPIPATPGAAAVDDGRRRAATDRLLAATIAGRGVDGGLGGRPRRSTSTLTAASRPVLHDGDGWIDFGPGRRLVLLLADRG